MKTPTKVRQLEFYCTCEGISMNNFDKLMENTTKANGKQIRHLIKENLPDLYFELGLKFYNPYESNCVKKEGLLVYVHCGIQYFLKFKQ